MLNIYRRRLKSQPIKVLNYCIKHEYPDLADETAPETVGLSVGDIVAGLSHPGAVGKWVRFKANLCLFDNL